MISLPSSMHNPLKTLTNMATTNAPSLLTAFGAVGVVTTAVLTAKGAFDAMGKINTELAIREADMQEGRVSIEDYEHELTQTEIFKLTWPCYLPAVFAGGTTIGAIVLSHRVSSKRAAVIAAAYALNENKLEEYQDKIKEKLGVKKEKEVRDEIAQDAVEQYYDENQILFSPLDGKVIIRDEYSGRFFWSTVELINQAVNEVNADILLSDSVTLSDFYSVVGLDRVSTSDYVGWNTRERLEIDWSTCTTPDGSKAVHSFAFVNPPFPNPGSNASF